MWILASSHADVLPHCTWYQCQVRSKTALMILLVTNCTTVTQTKSEECTAQSSTSWRRTHTHSALLHTSATLPTRRDTTGHVIEVANMLLMCKTLTSRTTVPEPIMQSTQSSHSTSRLISTSPTMATSTTTRPPFRKTVIKSCLPIQAPTAISTT